MEDKIDKIMTFSLVFAMVATVATLVIFIIMTTTSIYMENRAKAYAASKICAVIGCEIITNGCELYCYGK